MTAPWRRAPSRPFRRRSSRRCRSEVAIVVKKAFFALSLIAAAAGGAGAVASQGSGSIPGLWSTGSQGGRVELYRCGAAICRPVNDAAPLRANPDQPDVTNTDPAHTHRVINGQDGLQGFNGGPR